MDDLLALPSVLSAPPSAFHWTAGETPFSAWQFPFFAVPVYLLTLGLLRAVLGGPLPRVAPKVSGGSQGATKRPLTATNAVLAVHNFILMALSMVMFAGCAVAMYERVTELNLGVFDLVCDPSRGLLVGATYFWPYVFYLSKYWELLDTVFMVVKRQELPFLHVYHHCVTLTLSWVGMNFDASSQFVPLLLNTGVHILMYYNYAMTALGNYVWWKSYLTRMQMIQFWLNVFGICLWLFFNSTTDGSCTGYYWTNFLCLGIQLSFFVLFQSFFVRRYKKD